MNGHEQYDIRFKVASYESDLTGRMSLFALFNRFQDLAGEHAEYLKVGYDILRELRLAWILSRIKLQIFSLPEWGNNVKLTTWPKGIDRLFAMREFSLENENGETLVLATSAWLLVDIDKSRPRKIETLPVSLLYPGAPHAIKEVPDKIQLPDNLMPVFKKPIWLSDIDTNLHVNNAQYAKWICDCFPESQSRSRQLTSIQINFQDETLQGDTIELLKSPENELADEYFICGKSLKKGSITFNAAVTWKNRGIND